jgi:hypothetical protein
MPFQRGVLACLKPYLRLGWRTFLPQRRARSARFRGLASAASSANLILLATRLRWQVAFSTRPITRNHRRGTSVVKVLRRVRQSTPQRECAAHRTLHQSPRNPCRRLCQIPTGTLRRTRKANAATASRRASINDKRRSAGAAFSREPWGHWPPPFSLRRNPSTAYGLPGRLSFDFSTARWRGLWPGPLFLRLHNFPVSLNITSTLHECNPRAVLSFTRFQ